MNVEVGYATALLGGVAAIFSPCSALLLPAFLAYAFSSRQALFGRTLLLYLGMCTTLVPLGAAAGGLGALIVGHRGVILTTTSVVVILLGLLQACGVALKVPVPDWSGAGAERRDVGSPLSVYLLGTAYGITGVCAGPILGSMLALAAHRSNPTYGGLLLALFALGMLVPVVVLALLWDRFQLGKAACLRPRPVHIGPVTTTVVNLVSGLLFVAIGVFMLTTDGGTAIGLGLEAGTQAELEGWLQQLGSGVHDGVVIGTLAAVLAAVAWLWHRRRAPVQVDRPDASDQSPSA